MGRTWEYPQLSGGVERDRDYDWVPPIQESHAKRGMQCGQCGMKFEYGQAYGYCCMHPQCPTSFRPR